MSEMPAAVFEISSQMKIFGFEFPIVKVAAERLILGRFALRDLRSASEEFGYKSVRDAIRGWSLPVGWGEYAMKPHKVELPSRTGPRLTLHPQDVPEPLLEQILTARLERKITAAERRIDKREK